MSDQSMSVDFQQPTVARIVHFFQAESSEPLAALVLGGIDQSGRYGTCTLKVFALDGNDFVLDNVIYVEKKADDAASWWAWPARV